MFKWGVETSALSLECVSETQIFVVSSKKHWAELEDVEDTYLLYIL